MGGGIVLIGNLRIKQTREVTYTEGDNRRSPLSVRAPNLDKVSLCPLNGGTTVHGICSDVPTRPLDPPPPRCYTVDRSLHHVIYTSGYLIMLILLPLTFTIH